MQRQQHASDTKYATMRAGGLTSASRSRRRVGSEMQAAASLGDGLPLADLEQPIAAHRYSGSNEFMAFLQARIDGQGALQR